MSDPKQVKFKFIRAAGVTVAPINGFWCYQTQAGVLVDLYHERPQPTLSVTHEVANEALGSEVEREIGEEVVREILASLEMSPHTALALGKHLVEMAKQRGVVVAANDVATAAGSQKVH